MSAEITQSASDVAEQSPLALLRLRIMEVASTPFYAVLAGLIAVYGIAAWLVIRAGTGAGPLSLSLYNEKAAITSGIFLVAFLIFRPLYVIAARWPARPFRVIGNDLGKTIFSLRRIIQALPVIVLFPIFFSLFTCFKYDIPLIVPFYFDPLLAKADSFLHGGKQPWELLQPLAGFIGATFAIACAYKLWFFIKFCALYWQAFSTSKPAIRAQFFLSSILTWIINGSIFALIFSSAGPCYFGLLYPDLPNPYAGLMDYLHTANAQKEMWFPQMREFLWQSYTDRSVNAFAGISAFPSIHVANAFIFLLAASYYGRALTAVFAVFFVMIFIGSIHLGWHYAVDGYFSVLTTWLIWVWSGRLVRKFRLHEPRVKTLSLPEPLSILRPGQQER